MPYKFENSKLYIPKKHDKRIKLSDADKEEIKQKYSLGTYSMRGLAREYNVSHKMIGYVLNPDKYKEDLEKNRQRRKDGRYYDRIKQREQTKAYRHHKKQLYDANELIVEV